MTSLGLGVGGVKSGLPRAWELENPGEQQCVCDSHSWGRSPQFIPFSERPPTRSTPLLRIQSDSFFVLGAPTGGTPKPPHQLDSGSSAPPSPWVAQVDTWPGRPQGWWVLGGMPGGTGLATWWGARRGPNERPPAGRAAHPPTAGAHGSGVAQFIGKTGTERGKGWTRKPGRRRGRFSS